MIYRSCQKLAGLIILLIVLVASQSIAQEIIEQKKELETIRKEVEQSQARLDSLKNSQESLQRRIADHDQKMSSDRKVIGRLSTQLRKLEKDVGSAQNELDQHANEYTLSQKKYLGDIRQTYFALRRRDGTFDIDPNLEKNKYRQSLYLTAVANFESDNLEFVSARIDSSEANLEGLTGEKKKVNKLKHQKEVSFSLGKTQKSKQEKTLTRVKRKSQDEAERIMNLQMAAAEMEKIIARLEEQRELALRQQQGISQSSVFVGLKGQLRTPFRGKITERFGNIVDRVTYLKSFSPGITIKGRKGGAVLLVASGNVAYTGNLRGYGNFIIINHDNQYYTTYAGLGNILVSQGQHLLSGTKLATAGDDGIVKFELRRGREALDPVTWINFESL